MSGSIFGDLDVDLIGDDPFSTAAGTYRADLVDAVVKEKDGNTSFTLKWKINEPDNEFHGNTIMEFYPLFPGVKWEDYDGDMKKRTKFLKKRLREGFDLSEEEIKSVSPSHLVGKTAYITVVVNEGKDANTGKKFTNVQEALSLRLYRERQEINGELHSELGI